MNKKTINTIKKIKNYFLRYVRKNIGLIRAHKLGISYYPPNYVYLKKLNPNSIVVDVGCADDPDFSLYIMKKYNCKCYGIDPTRKHFPALKKVESDFNGKFVHLPLAVANKSGKLDFYESTNNTSGSILNSHINVIKDTIISYEVDAININELKRIVAGNEGKIDFMKLDLEGAEYNLLVQSQPNDFDNIDQIFIEFHHHCIDGVSQNDTVNLVQKIKNFGFNVFSIDQHNFLFYK
jgi:FkbM family methyltransferase